MVVLRLAQTASCDRSCAPAYRSSRVAPAGPHDGRQDVVQIDREDPVMTIIKPRTRGKQLVHYRTRLDRENHETLYAYPPFIGEDNEYVLNR